MSEKNKLINTTLKLWGIFIILIGLFVLALILPQVGNLDMLSEVGLAPYTFRLGVLFYAIVIISSILIIIKKRNQIKNIDIIIGLILGMLATLHRLDSVVFLLTSLAYIASMSIFNTSEIKMILFKRISCKAFVIVASILIISIVILFFHYGVLHVSSSFIRTLMPGITEEVVFRMFLFAISVWVIDGNTDRYEHNKFAIYLIMIVPFVVYHFPDILVESGFGSFMFANVTGIFLATIITLFAVKRDLASAIVIHILFNFYNFVRAENAIENIWQHQVPSILQIIYAVLR